AAGHRAVGSAARGTSARATAPAAADPVRRHAAFELTRCPSRLSRAPRPRAAQRSRSRGRTSPHAGIALLLVAHRESYPRTPMGGPPSELAPTVVMKFGGTSVADADRIRAAARRIVKAKEEGMRVVAVLS